MITKGIKARLFKIIDEWKASKKLKYYILVCYFSLRGCTKLTSTLKNNENENREMNERAIKIKIILYFSLLFFIEKSCEINTNTRK